MNALLGILNGHEYKPNPMYIFSPTEAGLLRSLYVSAKYREKNSLVILGVPFVSVKDPDDLKIYIEGMSEDADRIIISGVFATTLKTPHHIHENGEMEEQPGREGPIRTYFDGSSINNLGHAVAICIDRSERTITTQCPKGYDLETQAANILDSVFKGFAHHTITHKQQEDQHSCLPLTLRNIFAFAGVMPAKEKIDIMEWRGELLDELRHLHAYAHRSKNDNLKRIFEQNDREEEARRANMPVPIYAQKYADPAVG
jgi:hypothetical protein